MVVFNNHEHRYLPEAWIHYSGSDVYKKLNYILFGCVKYFSGLGCANCLDLKESNGIKKREGSQT